MIGKKIAFIISGIYQLIKNNDVAELGYDIYLLAMTYASVTPKIIFIPQISNAIFTLKIKGHYPSIYRDNDLNLLKANSLKPLLYLTRNSHLNLSYLVKPSYLFGSFFSFLSLGSFLGFLASLLPFFSLDISFTQLGLLVKATTFCY